MERELSLVSNLSLTLRTPPLPLPEGEQGC